MTREVAFAGYPYPGAISETGQRTAVASDAAISETSAANISSTPGAGAILVTGFAPSADIPAVPAVAGGGGDDDRDAGRLSRRRRRKLNEIKARAARPAVPPPVESTPPQESPAPAAPLIGPVIPPDLIDFLLPHLRLENLTLADLQTMPRADIEAVLSAARTWIDNDEDDFEAIMLGL